MNWLYGSLIFLAGCVAPFAFMATLEFADEVVREIRLWHWKRVNHGKWLIHSWSRGSDYSNGGRYTIYRCGFDIVGGKYFPEYCRWDPPMRTEAEALAECARLNSTAP